MKPGFKSREWPTLPLPRTPAEVAAAVERLGGMASFGEWLVRREELIDAEVRDPLRYGYELECWKKAREILGLPKRSVMRMPEPGVNLRMVLPHGKRELLVLGGNRAAKTTFAGKAGVVETLLDIPKAVVWCLHEDANASVERQQPVIYGLLPPELRDIGKKGKTTNVCYTVKNGFSEDKFILPNGSMCLFKNYAQYAQNQTAFEGGEADVVWCDELVPPDLLETLRYRLVTRGGLLLVTFTPLEGYSIAVKEYLEGSVVKEARAFPLLPGRTLEGLPAGQMPYVLECRKKSQAVVFFHSDMNPYNDWASLARVLEGKTREEIMCRGCGWPTRQIANAFPKVGPVHFVERSAIPDKGTNYLVVDNHGMRNWFMVWGRATPDGRIFVYREWPGVDIGDWAEPDKKADGKLGPAQKAEGGKGILSYKRIILEAEGWVWREEGARRWWDGTKAERVFQRYIDPRGGSLSVPGIEEGTSVIELMLEEQTDREGNVTGPSMLFIPAPAERVDAGAGLINDLLDYNPEQPVTVLNCPRLYLEAGCGNVIYALQTWTGADGEKGATKDPVDCLKMLAKTEAAFVDEDAPVCEGGGSY